MSGSRVASAHSLLTGITQVDFPLSFQHHLALDAHYSLLNTHLYSRGASQVALVVKNPPANTGSLREPGSGRSPGGGLATHSSILFWRIPWAEEPGGLQSIGSQRAGHDRSDLALTHAVFWEKRGQGGSSRIPKSHVQRFEMNLQQDLYSQGMVRCGQTDQPGHSTGLGKTRSPPPVPPTSPPLPALGNHILLRKKKKSHCFSLASFLADEHVKIDVSVIFTISRVAAKLPAGPRGGTTR